MQAARGVNEPVAQPAVVPAPIVVAAAPVPVCATVESASRPAAVPPQPDICIQGSGDASGGGGGGGGEKSVPRPSGDAVPPDVKAVTPAVTAIAGSSWPPPVSPDLAKASSQPPQAASPSRAAAEDPVSPVQTRQPSPGMTGPNRVSSEVAEPSADAPAAAAAAGRAEANVSAASAASRSQLRAVERMPVGKSKYNLTFKLKVAFRLFPDMRGEPNCDAVVIAPDGAEHNVKLTAKKVRTHFRARAADSCGCEASSHRAVVVGSSRTA